MTDTTGRGTAAEEDLIEIEVDEDLIAYYIEDEDGNELGFAILEDGVEVEYYYADDAAATKTRPKIKPLKQAVNEFDPGITKEGVAHATGDLNAIYKDGIEVARELKGAIDDISATFDFLKKKK